MKIRLLQSQDRGQTRDTTGYTSIWNCVFGDKEELLSRENIPRGFANVWDHPDVTKIVTSTTAKQFKHVEAATWEAGKVGYKTRHLLQNTEPRWYAALQIQFWKRVKTTCSLKFQWENTKNRRK